ncbi:MAG: EAL domain-containing protein [Rhodocyclaceae bacterium]|jgi:diguanylate cyclase (GGDEF)-like protein|nr:EAL domain-containing protein [Rhodocyclaceae bacterium]
MSIDATSRETPAHAIRLAVLTALLWSAAVVGSLVWNLHSNERQSMAMAYAEATAVRDKDMAFRRWGLKHSGVYVPATEDEPPTPFLEHVRDRDILTADGRLLTLRAPASMVREMMDDYAQQAGVRGRIVGLRYLNPVNAPDAWEKAQLEAFERGEKTEVWEVADMHGKPHLRYLQSWYMSGGCVRCHGILGYKVGDMRGATGVNLPLEPYRQRLHELAQDLIITHGSIWFIGLLGIGWAGRQSYQRASERLAAVEHIEYLAHHDSLTGLANRYSMESRLAQALASSRREEAELAVMLIDLDRFKNINDTLGHHIGDKLLVEAAQRLRIGVRESDIVARIGGDEFVVVLTGMGAAQDAIRVGTKVLEALGQPYLVEGHLLHSTPSIGISVYPGDGGDVDTLLKHADTAMYHAKESGRNNLRFFTADLTAAAAERMELERDLRTALDGDGLTLHFQPQVNAATGGIVGFEALARWQHPRRGWVPPALFIPIAEEAGLIGRLGARVMAQACAELAAWRAAGVRGIRVAVNLSAHQLRSLTLVDEVRATLQAHALGADDLELEVTESVAMADPEQAIEQLRALRDLGVQIAIDDFGTGYSSLAYLKRLPIQVLKIDRAFVSDIETDPNDAAICAATIALSKSLGLRVIAEGVETEAQRDYLARLGCDCLQGYLFGKPQPAADCFALLRPA